MGNVLQIGVTGTEVADINSLDFVSTASGSLLESPLLTNGQTNPNAGYILMSVSSAALDIVVQENYYGSPNTFKQPQLHLNAWNWLNQFYTYPYQNTQQGKAIHGLVTVMDKKVPGAQSDPGSGNIPQYEVPSSSVNGGADDANPAAIVFPFPSHTISA